MSGQAARLQVLIDAARDAGADLLVIDTAPNADQTALRATQLADLVLVPCRPAAFDLEAIRATLTLTQIAQKPSFVILNGRRPEAESAARPPRDWKGRGFRSRRSPCLSGPPSLMA